MSSRRRTSPISARLVLALLCACSAALLVVLGTRLTFFNDDWWFLLQRPGLESRGGLDVLLAPHNGNLEALLAAIYKANVAVFGFGPQLPFRLVIAAAIVSLGVLVYVIVAERLGAVIGLAAAAVILFLGPAWEALLFFGGSNHLEAVALGLGALLALEVATPRRNALACLLLVLAVSVSNTGIPFVAGAVIAVLLRRRPGALWIPAVPAVLFALWWAFDGQRQPTGITLGHIEHLPRYLFDAISIGLASITGLQQPSLPAVISSGHLLTLLATVLIVVWLVRGGRPGAWTWVFAVTLLAFWVLTGASAIPGRSAASSRYQLPDGALLGVLIAELARDIRPTRLALGVLGVIVVAIVASNLIILRHGYDFLRVQSSYVRADLGALQIAGRRAPRTLWLLPPIARDPYLSGVTAGRYFSVARIHGGPPYDSPAQILAAPPSQRQAADSVLAAAYGISARPLASIPGRRLPPCSKLAFGERVITPPGVLVRNPTRTLLAIGVARFAPRGDTVYVGFLPGRAVVRLPVPPDSLAIPWRIAVRNPRTGRGAMSQVCQLIR